AGDAEVLHGDVIGSRLEIDGNCRVGVPRIDDDGTRHGRGIALDGDWGTGRASRSRVPAHDKAGIDATPDEYGVARMESRIDRVLKCFPRCAAGAGSPIVAGGGNVIGTKRDARFQFLEAKTRSKFATHDAVLQPRDGARQRAPSPGCATQRAVKARGVQLGTTDPSRRRLGGGLERLEWRNPRI